MADVGRLAGVSAATVSFVLNANSGQKISPSTRERVLDAVARLEYRPNRTARNLRTRRTATIGFVTDEIAVQPFAGATILGAHEVAWAHGSLLLVVNTTRDEQMTHDVIDDLIDRPVDAVLFAVLGTRRVVVPPALRTVPSLLVNGYVRGGGPPAVLPDEVSGGRAAATMLLAAGHRRVAYLTGATAAWATRARLRGMRRAFAEAGVPEPALHTGNFQIDSGYQLTKELLASARPRPTALMCGNDRMAVGAYLALGEAGLRVPGDMSVVGYDDQPDLAATLRPALSTVRLPYHQLGRWAALQVVAGEPSALPARTYLPCPPVPRDSIAPLPGGAAR